MTAQARTDDMRDPCRCRLLPTTVVGSYSVPEWLERLKTDFYQRRISGPYLDEIHEVAIKAALKDQERAGVDIVSDGELRRDNDIDYFLARHARRRDPARRQDVLLRLLRRLRASPAPGRTTPATLGLVDDLASPWRYTDRPVKFSFTGPFSLSRRLHNEAYASRRDLVLALARVLNREAQALAAAGAAILQIDEPFLAGYPDDVDLAIEAINVVYEGVDGRMGRCTSATATATPGPSWEGHYDFLFPAVLDAQVDQLVLEFARKGYDDLELFAARGRDRNARSRRHRREEPPGRAAGAGRVPDPPGARRARPAATDRQPRLRPAAPAARHRPGQARRDGRGQRGRAGRAAARRPAARRAGDRTSRDRAGRLRTPPTRSGDDDPGEPGAPLPFTSESVTEGHPDKIADQISAAVVDAALAAATSPGAIPGR